MRRRLQPGLHPWATPRLTCVRKLTSRPFFLDHSAPSEQAAAWSLLIVASATEAKMASFSQVASVSLLESLEDCLLGAELRASKLRHFDDVGDEMFLRGSRCSLGDGNGRRRHTRMYRFEGLCVWSNISRMVLIASLEAIACDHSILGVFELTESNRQPQSLLTPTYLCACRQRGCCMLDRTEIVDLRAVSRCPANPRCARV